MFAILSTIILHIYIHTYTYELHRSLFLMKDKHRSRRDIFFSPLTRSAEQKEYKERDRNGKRSVRLGKRAIRAAFIFMLNNEYSDFVNIT
jgi:adenine specific DNA methylase Mod